MSLQPDAAGERAAAGSVEDPLALLATPDEHLFSRPDRALTGTPIISVVAPARHEGEGPQPIIAPVPNGNHGSVVAEGCSAEPEIPAASGVWVPPRSATLVDLKRRYAFYRMVRRAPENSLVRRRHAVSPFVGSIPSRVPGLASVDRVVRTRVFVRDLQLLNDVLSLTPCFDRYWVWSGLLLGWAREGRVLPHDLRDADFAYAEEDEPLILDGIEALVRAGFRRGFSLRNNAGQFTEHTVIRHGARFEFFRMSPVASEWEYQLYCVDRHLQVQLTARLPRQPLAPFDFVDRKWLKPLDHDQELSLAYGDWHTPDPSWDNLEQGGIVGREEWTGG